MMKKKLQYAVSTFFRNKDRKTNPHSIIKNKKKKKR